MDKQALQANPRLLRLPDVERCTGLKKSHLYEAIKAGAFPKPVKHGRASLFVENEVFEWCRARIAERDGSTPPERLLVTERELAQALGISVSSLQKDRAGNQTIPFIKIGQNVRYDLEEARQALKAMSAGGKRS